MVRTWNREPSSTLSNSPLDLDLNVRERVKSPQLSRTPRFVRDANSTVPNFLNGSDGQNQELKAVYRGVNTNTHTQFSEERLATCSSEPNLSDRPVRSSMQSSFLCQRPPSPSARSMVCNDTRYDLLHDPYVHPLGPGSYETENAQPPLGPLPNTSLATSGSPARDPLRMSSSFVSPRRKESYPFLGVGADMVYVQPETQAPATRLVPFDRQSSPFRTSVADWRFASRLQDMRRGMPQADYSDYKTDVSGRLVDVSKSADSPNPAGWAFASKTPRLATLPRQGTNDVRLCRGRGREDNSHLGPGTYSPSTSDNGKPKAKRSYRLFVPPHDASAMLSASFTRAMAKCNVADGSMYAGGGGMSPTRLPGSSSFQAVSRQQKFGPFTWKTDSALTRTL